MFATGLSRPLTLTVAALFLLQAACSRPKPAARADIVVVERGKYILHKFEQPIGEERYSISTGRLALLAEMHFTFTDRGTQVPLSATFASTPDLKPVSYSIKGKISRQSAIDDSLAVTPEKVLIRKRDSWSDLAPPAQYFTITGYAPIAMQMLMVRYWAKHGSPAELPIVPDLRTVRIEPRGRDTVLVDRKPEVLNRYTIEGLIWGRESLWFDDSLNLVAAVSTDAEFDHFEAVQERFEGALGIFVGRAGADGMAALAELSKKIAESRAPVLALVGGRLVDGTGSGVVEDAAVVIEDGRIRAAGPRAGVRIPAGAQVVDARNKTILPGLWDMHAHVEQVEWGPIYLAAGATTVRDCGNEFEFITAVRDAVARGRGLGPRILAAGIVDGSGPSAIGVERVDTPEEAREWTRRYHAAGFQQMKIYSSVKLEEVKAVADEAHRLGMTVTGHVPSGLTIYQVVEAGQDQINHIPNVLEIMIPPLPPGTDRQTRMNTIAAIDVRSVEARKAIAFLKAHGTVIDPTLAVYELATASARNPLAGFEPGVTKVAPELAAQYQGMDAPSSRSELMLRIRQTMMRVVGELHKAGVVIVAGTDQAVPGHSLHRELELYVEAGFTPMEAIQAATLVPARVMKLARELGTVEAGKRADVIILRGNPLENIHNIRTVETVIASGVMYNTADLWKSVGFKP